MTEAEWLASDDPDPMLALARRQGSDRKMRLFVAYCCRLLFDGPVDDEALFALAVAERLAEVGGVKAKTATVRLAEGQVALDCGATDPVGSFHWTGYARARRPAIFPPGMRGAVGFLACSGELRSEEVSLVVDWVGQAGGPVDGLAWLLRELVGNPFQVHALERAWRDWEGGVIRGLAEVAYEERAWDRLPILADALEDAGCRDEAILSHLRSPGMHVRGCWALDLILGKA